MDINIGFADGFAAGYKLGKEYYKPKWISVSEWLPEKDGDYLTTLTDKDGNYVDVTEWQNIIGGRWVAPLDECDYCEIGNVIAWMPLPEPYQKGG